jgi:hypothetical protein
MAPRRRKDFCCHSFPCAAITVAACLPVQPICTLPAGLPPVVEVSAAVEDRLVNDPVTQLAHALHSGEAKPLDQQDERAFLRDLLARLNVPVASQVLVFSKTSMQSKLIDPHHPRAIYFSDEIYVGWVPGGLIEVIAHDPQAGPLFYIVERQPEHPWPRITASEDCLACHESTRTRNVPGLLVRSLYIDPAGQPIHAAGSFLSDHASPLKDRWGGWYVTGRHGDLRHMGNSLASWLPEEGKAELDREAGANVVSLADRIDTSAYLHAGSDIVALMVLEHQVGMLNRITEAAQAFQRALKVTAALHEEPPEPRTVTTLAELHGSARSVASHYAESVVDYMLFRDEAPLPDGGIEGDPAFQQAFLRQRRTSSNGDSLKDFHLHTRLFKNRCSHLIYSQAFQSLHPALKDSIYRQLWSALEPGDEPIDQADSHNHLAPSERARIRSILTETLADFPADLRADHSSQ